MNRRMSNPDAEAEIRSLSGRIQSNLVSARGTLDSAIALLDNLPASVPEAASVATPTSKEA